MSRLVTDAFFFYTFSSFVVLAGWNDSSIGPLLLPMREHYNVCINFPSTLNVATRLIPSLRSPFLVLTPSSSLFLPQISLTIVSLTFVFNFIGFLIAAVANVWLTDQFGFGKTILLGATCQMVAYALQCWAPPFPLFCFSFVVSGIGESRYRRGRGDDLSTRELIVFPSLNLALLQEWVSKTLRQTPSSLVCPTCLSRCQFYTLSTVRSLSFLISLDDLPTRDPFPFLLRSGFGAMVCPLISTQ